MCIQTEKLLSKELRFAVEEGSVQEVIFKWVDYYKYILYQCQRHRIIDKKLCAETKKIYNAWKLTHSFSVNDKRVIL